MSTELIGKNFLEAASTQEVRPGGLDGTMPRDVAGNETKNLDGALPRENELSTEIKGLDGTLPSEPAVNPDALSQSLTEKNGIDAETVAAERVDLNTINSHLEGDVHEVTGKTYARREVYIPDRGWCEGVFPRFESLFETELPQEMYQETDRKQFGYCNEHLSKAVGENPELKSEFNETQLEQIRDGETPDGYVWHHNEEPGRMQLVDEYEHAKSGHTGGRSLWGGGSEMRGGYSKEGVPV